MKDRPILFSGPMVRALLEDRKTQTRRTVKEPDTFGCLTGDCPHAHQRDCAAFMRAVCPYGLPGDLLWVRETHARVVADAHDPENNVVYRAHSRGETAPNTGDDKRGGFRSIPGRWTPGIHMPRWASRLTLRITDARVQRVQELNQAAALAEGVRIPVAHDSGFLLLDISSKNSPSKFLKKEQLGDPEALLRAHFASLWDDVNGTGAWKRNDWVWVVTFEVIRQNIDAYLRASQGKAA